MCFVLTFPARKAVEAGVNGIVISNHGGRQLDYAPPTISVLEEVTVHFLSIMFLEENFSL